MSTLEILGVAHSGDSLWVRLDDGEEPPAEFDVTPAELATARRSVQRGYSPRLHGRWVDESQVTTLIEAMAAPQPLYPLVACRDCDTGASQLLEGEPYCHAHARGFDTREDQ